MPELPDIMLYLHALESRVLDKVIDRVIVQSPYVLRTFDPPIDEVEGKFVTGLRRIGKRIVFELASRDQSELSEPLFLVVHLMIAGRFRWDEKRSIKPPGKIGLASFVFDSGSLHLVEASPEKRASIHLIRGEDQLAAMNPGGVNVLATSLDEFTKALRSENHTLKRSLTDPRLFDGIGNAYSDEILHAAGLSPVLLTQKITGEQVTRLFDASRAVLSKWIARLSEKLGDKFPGPGDVTAFRPDFAVHGKFDQPCPICATPVQRIRYAENETNYCPRCQTGGKLLADRSLSRLLKNDWPKSIDELERE